MAKFMVIVISEPQATRTFSSLTAATIYADAKTIAHRVQCLADRLSQLCDEYVQEAEVEAAVESEARDQAAYERKIGL